MIDSRSLRESKRSCARKHEAARRDRARRERLQEELLEIWQRTHLTVLFVTHSMEEAVLLSDRVVVMTAGPGKIETDYAVDLARPRDVSPRLQRHPPHAVAETHQPRRQAHRGVVLAAFLFVIPAQAGIQGHKPAVGI